MTEGTNKGLFIVVAIVIFGIFVGLSYLIFEDTLNPAMVNLFESAFGDNKDEEPTVPETNEKLFTYEKNSTGLTIIGYTGTETAISIPSKATFEGTVLPVTEIVGGRMDSVNAIKEVIIPDTVTTIGSRAFTSYGLTKVYLGKGVKSIGSGAFAQNSLTSIVIPSSVEVMEDQVFMDNKLESIVIENNLKEIPYMTFYGNPTLMSIDFGNTVEIIGQQSFSVGETASENILTEIAIPDSVTTINARAFANQNIDTFVFGNGLKSIDRETLGGAVIKNIVISDSIKSIGPDAFLSSYSIETVNLGENLETIGKSAFYGNKIKELVIPNSVTSIGESSFSDNNISELTLGKNVKTIGDMAFIRNKIENLIVTDSVISIGESAFSANNMKTLVLGNSLKVINSVAFLNNDLKSVIIPDSTTTVAPGSFQLNPNLTEVSIPSSLVDNITGAFPETATITTR